MSKDKPTTLDRLVRGLSDGFCITGDVVGTVVEPVVGAMVGKRGTSVTAGRYGSVNTEAYRRDFGGTKTYKAAKAVGAAGGVGLHVATGGMSLLYGSLALNGIKGVSGLYHRLTKKKESPY
ncbi:hypothetical protein HYX13_01905 [Candidatus Woesearchaeota archaeon]|nr:hypothetical protein [Candidatus Woesearchaeota archaeon]